MKESISIRLEEPIYEIVKNLAAENNVKENKLLQSIVQWGAWMLDQDPQKAKFKLSVSEKVSNYVNTFGRLPSPYQFELFLKEAASETEN